MGVCIPKCVLLAGSDGGRSVERDCGGFRGRDTRKQGQKRAKRSRSPQIMMSLNIVGGRD